MTTHRFRNYEIPPRTPQTASCDRAPGVDGEQSQILQQVEAFALAQYHDARGSHDWDHTLRVVRLCRHIGPPEAADMPVLLSAAYLHDIGRGYQDKTRGAVCHAGKGAELAAPFVADLPFSVARKTNILHCIAAHRFRGGNRPETPEARVLFDADKLDAIGAVGVARAYLFAGEVGARLHNPDLPVEAAASYSVNDTGYREFRVKLCKIRDRMLTGTGRQLADGRHRFMEAFFERFIQEYNGER